MNVKSTTQYDSLYDLSNFLHTLNIITFDTSLELEDRFSDSFADEWEKCDNCAYVGLNNCDCFDDDECFEDEDEDEDD